MTNAVYSLLFLVVGIVYYEGDFVKGLIFTGLMLLPYIVVNWTIKGIKKELADAPRLHTTKKRD